MERIGDFIISDKTIVEENLQWSEDTYVFSASFNRVFQIIGGVSNWDDFPTILVDKDGELLDFINIQANNCYKITQLPEHFNYKQYSNEL